jgi:hypothetical protein
MLFCPQCAMEYTDDVVVCPDCSKRLVKKRELLGSGAAVAPDDSWISVCRVLPDLDADAIQGLLDSGNIPSMIMSAAFQPFSGKAVRRTSKGASLSIGDIVMVPREFRQEARILLETMLGENFDGLDVQA